MAALAFLVALYLFLVSSPLTETAAQKNISATSGQNVSLPCQVPNNKHTAIVKWTRPDLEPEYLLLYRDDQLDPENQHPSYKNRVDLLDRQMKDGDVSLVLKNMTTNDREHMSVEFFREN
ncbi:hypothetical protein GOODEAATRI_030398 [Goodea atripinnis]|uniref:Ig-like domain-containing protein n=1 Tax=Goodea atripinnis TaxID=208336 RepID=A0ABV0N5J8_9TELE